jgi:hypothetical protein
LSLHPSSLPEPSDLLTVQGLLCALDPLEGMGCYPMEIYLLEVAGL